MKQINFTMALLFQLALASQTLYASAIDDALQSYRAQLQENEHVLWEEFDSQASRAQFLKEPQDLHLVQLESTQDSSFYIGHTATDDAAPKGIGQLYVAVAQIPLHDRLLVIQYELRPDCAHCLRKIDDFKKFVSLMKNPEQIDDENFAQKLRATAASLSWPTLVGTGLSVAFGIQYWRTKNPVAALVSVASLGMLFVCPCNGQMRFGPCPQKMATFAVALLALVGINQAHRNQE